MKPQIIYWNKDTIHMEDSKGKFRVKFKILRRKLKVNNEFESWDNLYTVSFKAIGRRLRREFVRELIADLYTGTYCRHSHDCCGCSFWRTYYSNIVPTKHNEYRIRQHVYINC
jgi:hypothetical protein